MVVKLPNSISFENRILKLMNEPEKVTYRYRNTETKKINSITFQNFQKILVSAAGAVGEEILKGLAKKFFWGEGGRGGEGRSRRRRRRVKRFNYV